MRDAFSQFPAVCFTLTLLTDIAYYRTSHLMWVDFSSWLLFAGLVGGGLALLATVVGFFVHRDEPWRRARWPFVAGGLLALALAFLNSLVHARDGWTAVVPAGLNLSALTVVVMIATAVGGHLVARHRIEGSRP